MMVIEFIDVSIEVAAETFKSVGAHEDLYLYDADKKLIGWVNRDAAAAVYMKKEDK